MSQRLTREDVIGAWIDDDDDFITITASGDTLDVEFRSSADDEELFEVTAVKFTDGQLSFQIRVPSTGFELSYVSKGSDDGNLVFSWKRLDVDDPEQAGMSTLRPDE